MVIRDVRLAPAPMTLVPDTRRSLLRAMMLARGVDEEALQLANQGALDLWLSCQGHEAAQVGSAVALGPEITIVPSYREHAVALTRGIAAEDILAQWAGETFCGWDPWRHRFFPYTLILAAQTLHAVGYALGRRMQGHHDVVAVYVGDGATSEGDMSEALNLAAVESAPVLFICQNNGWAISKPTDEQMLTSIAQRARGFGIDSTVISGQDPEVVHQACRQAVDHVSRFDRPYLVEIQVARIHGHSTSDAQETYRSRDDIATARNLDPVLAYAHHLTALGLVDEAWRRRVDEEVDEVRRRLVERFT